MNRVQKQGPIQVWPHIPTVHFHSLYRIFTEISEQNCGNFLTLQQVLKSHLLLPKVISLKVEGCSLAIYNASVRSILFIFPPYLVQQGVQETEGCLSFSQKSIVDHVEKSGRSRAAGASSCHMSTSCHLSDLTDF